MAKPSLAELTPSMAEEVFEIIDSVIASIDPLREQDEFATAPGRAELSFSLPRQNQDWSFRLTGNLGTAQINATLSEGNEQNFVDAVNARSDETGIRAELDEFTGKVRLIDPSSAEIKMDQIEIEGQDMAVRENLYYVEFRTIDEDNIPIGTERILTDSDQLLGRGIENLKNSLDHMALQQASIGAQMSKADIQTDVLASRKLAVTKDVSKLGDADLAALVTELQQQITNRDAAQQAFAKIGQQSLFDFIR